MVLLGLAASRQAAAQTVYFVDDDAPSSNPMGTGGWIDAWPDLQKALQIAGPTDTILIAEGTYAPDTANMKASSGWM